MKTPEEIQKIAEDYAHNELSIYPDKSKNLSEDEIHRVKTVVFSHSYIGFKNGYTQCQKDKLKKIEEQNTNIEDRVIVLAQQYALEKCKDNMSALTKVKVAVEYGFKVCYEQFQKENDEKVFRLVSEITTLNEEIDSIKTNNKYTEEDVINALHQAELKHNKNYTEIFELMKSYLQSLNKR